MWSTPDGPRALCGAQAKLFRGAIGTMTDHLVDECVTGSEAWEYGIAEFDRFDARQRLWLLERVTVGLFSDAPPPRRSAMIEATFEALIAEIIDLIELEVSDPQPASVPHSWRTAVANAYCEATLRDARCTADHTDLTDWIRLAARVGEHIHGVYSYRRPDAGRDEDPRRTRQFLDRRGLPSDFFSAIPPLRSIEQTQRSIDRIQAFVFRGDR